MVPPVTANAFAAINSSFLTNSGSPADNPERIKRLTPKAIKTNKVKTIPVEPVFINHAIINKFIALK